MDSVDARRMAGSMVLITGSSGYIGRYLTRFLEDRKIRTIPFDLSEGNDILNSADLKRKLKHAEYIIHLAAVADVYQAAKDPINALKIGIEGTTRLVQAAHEFPIKKLIYISTWEVYGKPRYQPLDEGHNCNPDHPYSIAKYAGELIIKSYLNKTPWIILRLGTVYGDKMRQTTVMSKFINNCYTNQPIIINGQGDQKRQFTHIEDIANGIYLALKSNKKNDIFNIIDNDEISIKELAFLIKTLTHSKTKINFGDKRLGDVIPAYVSNKKALQGLGWSPKSDIKGVLKKMINDWKRP